MEEIDLKSINIPLSSDQERERYYQGVLALLGRIEILESDAELNDELKPVYELLTLLQGTESNKTKNKTED